MGLFSERIEARFAARVELVPFSDCHYWMGTLNGHGYGVLSVNGRPKRAHRLAYELRHGFIPEIDGKPAHLLHSCDQPCCVNPDHLRPGTPADNSADKVSRGRQFNAGKRKLSDADVREIFEAIAGGADNATLAARFGVVESRISAIRHGNAYARFASGTGFVPATARSDRRLTSEQARAVYADAHKACATQREIADTHGVSLPMVRDIKWGRTYASSTGHGR